MADRLAFLSLLALVVVVPFSSSLAEVFASTLFVCWLLSQFNPRHRLFWRSLPLWLWASLAALILWIVTASAFSLNPALSLKAAFSKWGQWIFIAVSAFATLSSAKRLKIFAVTLLASSFLIVADGLWQYFYLKDFLRDYPLIYGLYPTASFHYYTHYACYLTVLLIIGLGVNLARGVSIAGRGALILHHTFFLVALVLTYSRGALLGMLVGFAGLALFREKKLLGLGALCLILLLGINAEALLFRFRNPEAADWGGYRLQMWASAWEMFRAHWGTGVGINNFVNVIESYGGPRGYAHNSFLQFAAETGIPGISFLAFWIGGALLWSLRRLFQAPAEIQGIGFGVLFALIAFLTHSFFENTLYVGSLAMLFWLLSGALLAAAALRFSNQEVFEGRLEKVEAPCPETVQVS